MKTIDSIFCCDFFFCTLKLFSIVHFSDLPMACQAFRENVNEISCIFENSHRSNGMYA